MYRLKENEDLVGIVNDIKFCKLVMFRVMVVGIKIWLCGFFNNFNDLKFFRVFCNVL